MDPSLGGGADVVDPVADNDGRACDRLWREGVAGGASADQNFGHSIGFGRLAGADGARDTGDICRGSEAASAAITDRHHFSP